MAHYTDHTSQVLMVHYSDSSSSSSSSSSSKLY